MLAVVSSRRTSRTRQTPCGTRQGLVERRVLAGTHVAVGALSKYDLLVPLGARGVRPANASWRPDGRRFLEAGSVNLDGKHILVTGGTGSLGQSVVERLLDGSLGRPRRVTVLSRDEAKQHDMRLRFLGRPAADDGIFRNAGRQLHLRIGDVRDFATMCDAVRDAQVVIHVAALKQVPTCEYHPLEAVQTNVLGAAVLARAVRTAGHEVEAVVGISTDKACKPVNVMGMTKAIMERVLVEANLGCARTRFVVVRYGNVLGSRGSVIPLFLDQIAHGGPVTVTMREMTRFMLTPKQATDAVFDALEDARPGEIYVPKAPSARVLDLALALMDGRDVPVAFTGIRPGEKIHEIMVSEEECHRTVARGEYYVVCPMLPECGPEWPARPVIEREYSSADATLDHEGLRALLRAVVPGDLAEGALRDDRGAERARAEPGRD